MREHLLAHGGCTHGACHGDQLWAVLQEEFDHVRVVILCSQVQGGLSMLQIKGFGYVFDLLCYN